MRRLSSIYKQIKAQLDGVTSKRKTLDTMLWEAVEEAWPAMMKSGPGAWYIYFLRNGEKFKIAQDTPPGAGWELALNERLPGNVNKEMLFGKLRLNPIFGRLPILKV